MNTEEVLFKNERMLTLVLNIRKRELKFIQHIMRKEGFKNLTLTGPTKGKRDRGKPT